MKKLRNRTDVKLINSKKDYLKYTSKSRYYMSHKIADNKLVAIRNTKYSLKLKKPADIGTYILELSKVWMYKFHYDYLKNKYDKKSKLLFKNADSLMYGIKIEDFYENFSNKEMLHFIIVQLSQNAMMIQTN